MWKWILANHDKSAKRFSRNIKYYSKWASKVKLGKKFSFWFQIIGYSIIAILILIAWINAS